MCFAAAVVVLAAAVPREIGKMQVLQKLKRTLKHLCGHPWQRQRYFSVAAIGRIEAAISQSEQQHAGELRLVVETALPLSAVLRGVTPRARALEAFAHLHIWDTEHNTGVLIYLNLADRDVEIIADRGIHRHVGELGWQTICQQMEHWFRQGLFEQGVLHGVTAISALLAQCNPPQGAPRNELSNRVVLC